MGCAVMDGVVDDEDVEKSANFLLMDVDLVRSEIRLDDNGNGTKAAAERIPPERRMEVKRPVMAK